MQAQAMPQNLHTATNEALAAATFPVTVYEVVKTMRDYGMVGGCVAPVMVLGLEAEPGRKDGRMLMTAIDNTGDSFRGQASDFYMTEGGAKDALAVLLIEAGLKDCDEDLDLDLDLDGYDGLCGNCADLLEPVDA